MEITQKIANFWILYNAKKSCKSFQLADFPPASAILQVSNKKSTNSRRDNSTHPQSSSHTSRTSRTVQPGPWEPFRLKTGTRAATTVGYICKSLSGRPETPSANTNENDPPKTMGQSLQKHVRNSLRWVLGVICCGEHAGFHQGTAGLGW